MAELTELRLLDKLESDIERILSVNEALRKQNDELHKRNEALEQQNQALSDASSKQQKQLDRVLIQKSITDTAADVDSAKLRLDRLIREVDRCIALMNK